MLDPASEDATLSWGAVAAQQLDADFEILAWAGAKQNQNGSTTPTVPQLFTQLIAGDNSTIGDAVAKASWSPQVPLGGIGLSKVMVTC